MPDVVVTLTNIATTAKQTITTGGDGAYTFVNVVPGQYLLEADKAGFKHVKREGVDVQVQQGVRIDVSMEVGAVSQTVEVTGRDAVASAHLLLSRSGDGTAPDERNPSEWPQRFQFDYAFTRCNRPRAGLAELP